MCTLTCYKASLQLHAQHLCSTELVQSMLRAVIGKLFKQEVYGTFSLALTHRNCPQRLHTPKQTENFKTADLHSTLLPEEASCKGIVCVLLLAS